MTCDHDYRHVEIDGVPVGVVCPRCDGSWLVMSHETLAHIDKTLLAVEGRLGVLERNMAHHRAPSGDMRGLGS